MFHQAVSFWYIEPRNLWENVVKGVKSLVVGKEIGPKSCLYTCSGVGAIMILNIGPIEQNGKNIESRNEMVECKPPKCSSADGNGKHSEPEYTHFGTADPICSSMPKGGISKKRTDPEFPKEVASVTNTKTVFCKIVAFSVFLREKVTVVSKMIFSIYGDVISKRPAV